MAVSSKAKNVPDPCPHASVLPSSLRKQSGAHDPTCKSFDAVRKTKCVTVVKLELHLLENAPWSLLSLGEI